VSGSLPVALRRLREGGWVILSKAVAADHGLRIGQRFTLPAPHPLTLRIAALITNLGWPPGAIILNPADYIRAWGNANPSAYTISLSPRASPAQVSGEIRRALGSSSALTVQTAQRRDELQLAASRQGLSRLTQISVLLLITTILAMSIAMSTVIWQRRPVRAHEGPGLRSRLARAPTPQLAVRLRAEPLRLREILGEPLPHRPTTHLEEARQAHSHTQPQAASRSSPASVCRKRYPIVMPPSYVPAAVAGAGSRR
jgi:hypothetical protein